MRVTHFQIVNYKSFRETEKIPLGRNVTVIVGQNNVGKTALAEALSLRFRRQSHRSLSTIPANLIGIPSPPSESVVSVWCEATFEEMIRAHSRDGLGPLLVPFDDPGEASPQAMSETVQGILERLHQLGQYRIVYESRENGDPAPLAHLSRHEGLGDPNQKGAYQFHLTRSADLEYGGVTDAPANNVIMTPHHRVATELTTSTYCFRAERPTFDFNNFPSGTRLDPNARNLPRALRHLQTSNTARFTEFIKVVGQVLPDIKNVTIYGDPDTPSGGFNLEIRLWTDEQAVDRDDLYFSLADSGTGVGQILALLYVVFTERASQIIIIDEPQSFLHPGAIRKLFDLLRTKFGRHQYIVTTHSPTVISAADPEMILLVTKDGPESRIEPMDSGTIMAMRRIFDAVGTTLADVFGSDSILWVEGPTEEACFPLILRHVAGMPLLGTVIASVHQTGDFEGRQRDTAFDIYTKLSLGKGLLPRAKGFIFDRERRKESDRRAMELASERRGGGKVLFLPRTMYENYLLHPAAISEVINTEMKLSADQPYHEIAAEDVSAWLVAERDEQDEVIWLHEADGTKVLHDAFSHFTDQRLDYEGNKVYFGELLTRYLVVHDKSQLREVADLLSDALA